MGKKGLLLKERKKVKAFCPECGSRARLFEETVTRKFGGKTYKATDSYICCEKCKKKFFVAYFGVWSPSIVLERLELEN